MIRFPSGDHDGYSPPSVCGRQCCPEPSAFMIEIPVHRDPRPGGQFISPGLAYAILEPSGDQAGERPRVSRCWPDPSAFMSQISESSLRSGRSTRNAIRVPSGDHVGSNSGQGEWVRRVRLVPSALMDQTSSKLSKTIRPESEDRSPSLGPGASEAAVDGDGRSCGCSRSDPPLHAPSTRAPTTAIERMRPLLMPFVLPGRPHGSHSIEGSRRCQTTWSACPRAGFEPALPPPEGVGRSRRPKRGPKVRRRQAACETGSCETSPHLRARLLKERLAAPVVLEEDAVGARSRCLGRRPDWARLCSRATQDHRRSLSREHVRQLLGKK